MTTLFALLACSPSFDLPSSAPAVVTPDVAAEDPGGPEAHRVASAPQYFYVELPELTGRTVEVVPFGDLGGTVMVRGGALASEVADFPVFEMTLPTRPAAISDELDELTYAIALRETEEDGSAGVYLGISDATLVWTEPVDDEDAWSLVINYGADNARTIDVDDGASVYENLQGWTELRLEGTSQDQPEGAHLALADCSGATCRAAVDVPMGGGTWTVDIAGAPAEIPATTDLGVRGATYALEAYADEDGDNRRTDEVATGEACLGEEPIALTWFDEVRDLPTALRMHDARVRTGWTPYLATEDVDIQLNPDELGQFSVRTACH